MVENKKYDWTERVFTPENAGPWAILITVLAFEGLATLPRDSLPGWLQTLIPLVLGCQYAVGGCSPS